MGFRPLIRSFVEWTLFCFSLSVLSDSLATPWTAARQAALCPWAFPGENTAVGSHFLLQGIFPTQGSDPHLLHCRQFFTCEVWDLEKSLCSKHHLMISFQNWAFLKLDLGNSGFSIWGSLPVWRLSLFVCFLTSVGHNCFLGITVILSKVWLFLPGLCIICFPHCAFINIFWAALHLDSDLDLTLEICYIGSFIISYAH